MDRIELGQVLQEIDDSLTAPCEIVLVGGAAMILHFGASRATRDIDMIVLRGNVTELRQAIRRVALARNWPEDWMNDGAKGFADIWPPDFSRRLVALDLPLRHLRLYVLGRPEQAAMKIVALREQDLEDLELLLPAMSEADKRTLFAIMQHVSRFRPDWALKIKYFLQEQGWTIE